MGIALKDLKSFLETLPCIREEGGNHTKYILEINGKVIAWTLYSRSWRGNTQIDASIISKQAKQMKCSSNGLWKRLLTGQASKEEYFRDLLDHRHINRDEYQALCAKGNVPHTWRDGWG